MRHNPVVCAADAAPTKEQQAQLRLSDLEWALGVSARDDQQDPIRATHHFYRAARRSPAGGTGVARHQLFDRGLLYSAGTGLLPNSPGPQRRLQPRLHPFVDLRRRFQRMALGGGALRAAAIVPS